MICNGWRAVAALIIFIASLAGVTACSDGNSHKVTRPSVVMSDSPTSGDESSHRAALRPVDTAHSDKQDADISIMSVEDANLDEGSGVVFTFQVWNRSATNTIADDNWQEPYLSYGPQGRSVHSVVSSETGDGEVGSGQNGPIPPGARRTIETGYAGVTKSQLTDVVLTEGSITWRGDFTDFKRDDEAPAHAPTTSDGETYTDTEVSADNLSSTVKSKLAQQPSAPQIDQVVCAGTLVGTVGATQHCTVESQGQWYPISVTTTSVDGTQVNFDYHVAPQPMPSAPSYAGG